MSNKKTGEIGMIADDFKRWLKAAVCVVLVVGMQSGCEVKTGATTTATAPPKVDSATSPAESSSTSEPKADAQSKDKVSVSSDSQEPSKTISAEGSSTVYPICQAFAVEFEKKFKHTVSVGRQGTGGGYKKFVNRQADIWNASRPIAAKEIDELKKKGIEWIELNIAVDGIVVAVHAQNTWCQGLTCAQLKQIWEPDSKIQKWSDLDSSWPAEPILLYGADTDSGTFEYFTEVINGKKGSTNTKYTPASDDNVLVQGISTNKGALGYIPFGYYIENTEKLRAIGVSPTKDASETAAPYVEPTVETILSGAYAPLSRPLFMYVDKAALKRPEVGKFLSFAVSEVSQELVEKRGFVRLKDEARKEAVSKLEAAIADVTNAKSE